MDDMRVRMEADGVGICSTYIFGAMVLLDEVFTTAQQIPFSLIPWFWMGLNSNIRARSLLLYI